MSVLAAEPWLNVDSIATHLGVARITIYRWLETNRIPAHRVGRLWRFKASEVDHWVSIGGAKEQSHLKRPPRVVKKKKES